jgi:hypothetical protein
MNRKRSVLTVLAPAVAVLAGCSLHGQHNLSSRFSGDWFLDKSFGATAPPGFATNLAISGDRVTVRSRWQRGQDDRTGLTLVGLIQPEMVLETGGRDLAAQVGPFVFRHASHWDGDRLVTRWSTSEFMGSSFRGTWTRSVSKDGEMQILDVDAVSSLGQVNRARLVFRRKLG